MCCKWSPNGRLCAVSGTGKELQIFDNVTQKTTQLTHSLRVDNVHFICWHSSSVVLFLFSRKGDIQIVDVAGEIREVLHFLSYCNFAFIEKLNV